MTAISVRPITAENWLDCISLQLTEAQEAAGFLSPNTFSLAQAHYEPWLMPVGLYHGETMVGFALWGRWPETNIPAHARPGVACILRFMIDRQHQGQGYGQASLNALIAQIRAQPDCREVELSVDPTNPAAIHVYTKAGFQPSGQLIDGEIHMFLRL